MTPNQELTQNPNLKALGTIWVRCPHPIVALGLHEVLEAEAHVYRGQRPPAKETLSLIISYLSEEDVVWEVPYLRSLAPEAPILVFGLRSDLELAQTAIRAGACGLLHAGMRPEQIVRAVWAASRWELVIPSVGDGDPEGAGSGRDRGGRAPDPPVLSAHQRAILGLAAEGLTKAQTAERLLFSESALKQHLRAAYKPLGVKNRTGPTKLFQRNDLVRGHPRIFRGGGN